MQMRMVKILSKKNRFSTSVNRGITLVELAITITTIALLIGTVLSSSILISNARTNAMMSEMYKYKTTFLMFKLRYYAIAGDMVNASTVIQGVKPSQNGNGNSQIDFSESSAGETLLPWVHLEKAGFIQSRQKAKYSGIYCCGNVDWGVTSLYEAGKNGPNVGKPNIPADISNITGANIPVYMFFYSGGGIPGNKLALTWSTQGKERPFYAPIAPTEQHRIDVKYDDGLPLTRHIISTAGNIAGTDIMVRNNPIDSCSQGNSYLSTPKTPGSEGCILILNMDK
jgi:Tfp pilus assembly protein PilE